MEQAIGRNMGAAQHRDNPAAREGASVIVLARDGVLMVERARAPFAGVWSFPGGRSEPGEAAEATARRELLEETGLTVGRLIRLGAFKPAPERTPLRLTVFAARAGAGRPQPGDDAVKAEFVPLSAVLERRTTPGAAGWIARALAALAEPPLP
jgi:ADP-ribose pyrophosphatase YjhB (NUDIX family)